MTELGLIILIGLVLLLTDTDRLRWAKEQVSKFKDWLKWS